MIFTLMNLIGPVRDPAKIEIEHDKLSVEKCNVFSKEEIRPHVDNAEVVLSCLGFPLQRKEPVP